MRPRVIECARLTSLVGRPIAYLYIINEFIIDATGDIPVTTPDEGADNSSGCNLFSISLSRECRSLVCSSRKNVVNIAINATNSLDL